MPSVWTQKVAAIGETARWIRAISGIFDLGKSKARFRQRFAGLCVPELPTFSTLVLVVRKRPSGENVGK
jgi:hypothetical protein